MSAHDEELVQLKAAVNCALLLEPASKAETRQAAAVLASMRTAYEVTEAAELVPA